MELPELPPLPEAAVHVAAGEWPEFARSQMLSYAREAMEIGRRAGLPWIPVDERLPEPEVIVLVAEVDNEVSQGHRVGADWYREPDYERTIVTHWMPIPRHPAAKE